MSRRHAARALALAGLALRAAAGWFRRVASLALLWIRRTPRPPRLAAIGFAVALTALGAGGASERAADVVLGEMTTEGGRTPS